MNGFSFHGLRSKRGTKANFLGQVAVENQLYPRLPALEAPASPFGPATVAVLGREGRLDPLASAAVRLPPRRNRNLKI